MKGLTCVQPHVRLESGCACEEDWADVALDVGRLTRVHPLVRLQRRLDREPFAAFVARKRFLAFQQKHVKTLLLRMQ